jgi:hypothetical protein
LARFSTGISRETLSIIADICLEQRIGLTLIEITQLFLQNNIIQTEDEFNIVVDRLKLFKDLSDNCEFLARSYCEIYDKTFTIKLIEPHLDLLMQHKQYEHFMPIFDRVHPSNSHNLFLDQGLSQQQKTKD